MQKAYTTKSTFFNDTDKKYFLDIFNLNAKKDGTSQIRKLDFTGLENLFNMVGFEPEPKQKKEFSQMFEKKKEITFDEFMQIFTLKQTETFRPTDIKNAFRLLSKEYTRENKISITRVEEILHE